MQIKVFTIRDKKTNQLIHAEGVPHDEHYPNFKLDKKWLDKDEATEAWEEHDNYYSFEEELRHITDEAYNKIIISLETIEIK